MLPTKLQVCILPTVCDHFWDLIQILILSRHRLRSGLSPQIRVTAAAASALELKIVVCCGCCCCFVCISSLRFALSLLRSSVLSSSSRSLLILFRLWCTRLPTTAAAMSSIGTGVTFFLSFLLPFSQETWFFFLSCTKHSFLFLFPWFFCEILEISLSLSLSL